ncbi:DUF951 domain-containing protein [Bacillus sp. B190/17]|uniref:DUF951 domain-containing protein n=1 Tax=Bacillus lumedeiriae TaxID=3058829 RepID=A0ABW8IAR0_9BACI
MEKTFDLHDVVEMKKPHPCGTNRWKIIRLGMDIRIKCEGCGHSVILPRKEFTKKMKKVIDLSENSSEQ